VRPVPFAEDLIPSDLVYRQRVGETYSVKYNPTHQWCYVPEMRRDEALLLKIADTKTDIPARFMPHLVHRPDDAVRCASAPEASVRTLGSTPPDPSRGPALDAPG
jgi:hypothetical protein